jgi:hypothetical protein
MNEAERKAAQSRERPAAPERKLLTPLPGAFGLKILRCLPIPHA